MINPYILKHTTDKATAEQVHVFLRDYFNICQRNRGTQKTVSADNAFLVHNLEDETVFPVWVVNVNKAYGITHNPLKAPQQLYDSIQLLTGEPTNVRLRRVNASLNNFSQYSRAEDTAQTMMRSLRGWYATETPSDGSCALFLVEKNDFFGVIDARGKVIVPPIYRYVIPMELESKHVSLLICRRANNNENTTNVYDIEGNRIFENIGGIYRYKDTVKYDLSPVEGNRPYIRFSEEICLALYGATVTAKPKTFVRATHLLHHATPKNEDGGPRQLHAMCDRPTIALETDAFSLFNIRETLLPIAEVVAAWRGETAEEVMLSIPLWNIARKANEPLPNVTADTAIIDIPDVSIPCFELLRRLGLTTAQAVANADLSFLCESVDDRLVLETSLLQSRIIATLK